MAPRAKRGAAAPKTSVPAKHLKARKAVETGETLQISSDAEVLPSIENMNDDDLLDYQCNNDEPSSYLELLGNMDALRGKSQKLSTQLKQLQQEKSSVIESAGDSANATTDQHKKSINESLDNGSFGEDDDEDAQLEFLDGIAVEDLSYAEMDGLKHRYREIIKDTEAKIAGLRVELDQLNRESKVATGNRKKLPATKTKASAITKKAPASKKKSATLKRQKPFTASEAAAPGTSGHKVTKTTATSPRSSKKGVAKSVKK